MVVLAERKYGAVMMIGDGINDAPALAAADVGGAMGANGAAASAEVADVILLVDQLDRVFSFEICPTVTILGPAEAYMGIGLSALGMIVAAFGYSPPSKGLQDIIDVVVILNALRARALEGERPALTQAFASSKSYSQDAESAAYWDPDRSDNASAGSPGCGDDPFGRLCERLRQMRRPS